MSTRITIYMADQVQVRIGPATSARVNAALDRYAEILAQTPVADLFTHDEWSALRDMQLGVSSEPAAAIAGSLSQGWADSWDDGLAKKWRVDADAVARKLAGLSYSEEVAVVEAIESWWRENG